MIKRTEPRKLASWAFAWAAMIPVGCSVGCFNGSDGLQQALHVLDQNRQNESLVALGDTQPELLKEQLIGELESLESDSEALVSAPFPDRDNPFEFVGELDFEGPQAGDDRQLEIKLYGFAGNSRPKAIFNIGGQTKMLAVGERWGGLEVIDISPPNVRLKSDGVLRVWSILGHRDHDSAKR